MRKALILFLALIIGAGCSTAQQTSLLSHQRDDLQPKEAVQGPKVPPPAESERTSANIARKDGGSVKVEYLNQEEEDDISLLLEPDQFQEFDIPIVFNDAVNYYIQWFTTEKRKVFGNWLKRSRHYVPIIREILKDQGMPEDLVYLAMIESGFNPRAYSHAKASAPGSLFMPPVADMATKSSTGSMNGEIPRNPPWRQPSICGIFSTSSDVGILPPQATTRGKAALSGL